MKQAATIPQATPGPTPARFQQIKAEIHRQIVSVIDVSGLTHWSDDRLRREVAGSLADRCDRERAHRTRCARAIDVFHQSNETERKTWTP